MYFEINDKYILYLSLIYNLCKIKFLLYEKYRMLHYFASKINLLKINYNLLKV